MRTARAFSLVETVVASGIVGVMLVAALSTVGASGTGQFKLSRSERAHLLAVDMMSEILAQDYEDSMAPDSLGPEGDEIGVTRAKFDDVDDYLEWSASPPQTKDGTEFSELGAYRRTVTVEFVGWTNLDPAIGADQDIKRIIVTVRCDGAEMTSLVAICSRGGQELNE